MIGEKQTNKKKVWEGNVGENINNKLRDGKVEHLDEQYSKICQASAGFNARVPQGGRELVEENGLWARGRF